MASCIIATWADRFHISDAADWTTVTGYQTNLRAGVSSFQIMAYLFYYLSDLFQSGAFIA